jgi:hypothetical protein
VGGFRGYELRKDVVAQIFVASIFGCGVLPETGKMN